MDLTKQNEKELASTFEERRMKAEFLADQIKLVNKLGSLFDTEFMKQAANDMINDASRMDSAAVLIRNYSPLKSELLGKQAHALMALANYFELVKECGELKTRIQKEDQHHADIAKHFGF